MQDLLAHPAVHAGVMPLAAGLRIAAALPRGRLTWLAIVGGYATVVALTTGFAFDPLTVSRKVTLAVLLAPVVGLVADAAQHRLVPRRSGRIAWGLVLASALLPLWVFSAMLAQRAGIEAVLAGLAMAAFVGALVWLMLRLRRDGAAAGAAGVGLGIGGGVAALLSAALGFFGNGIALAAASGAVLLVQLLRGRLIAPGFTGTLTIGLAASLSAVAAMSLAELPWYALPFLLLVPLACVAPRSAATSDRARIVVLSLVAVGTGLMPIAAAYLAVFRSASEFSY
jgi:hypothetical protein